MNATAERTTFPPFAPTLGVMNPPRVHPAEVSGEPEPHRGWAPANLNAVGATDAVPEALLGVGTASLSGALTGGLAAGSWRGAAIGAGATAGMWSAFNLLSSWRTTTAATKATLGVSALLGSALAAALYIQRRKR